MHRSRIRWRVPANSVFRVTHGGTRLEVDKNKLRARVLAANRAQAARRASSAGAGAGPSGGAARKGSAQQRAQAAQRSPGGQNMRPEKLLEAALGEKKLVWVHHPDRGVDVITEAASGCMVVGLNNRPIERASRVPFGTRNPNYEVLTKHLEEFEGALTHMYLDPNGNVTIGVGHKLESVEDAFSLNYESQPDDAAIRRDFEAVVRVGRLPNPEDYAAVTELRIDEFEYLELLDRDMKEKLLELKGRFPRFSTYPELVQRGMMDLVFNMGTAKFYGQFTRFRRALKIRNWARVAAESRRSELDAKGIFLGGLARRNDEVQGWFNQAAKANPYFVDPTCKVQVSRFM